MAILIDGDREVVAQMLFGPPPPGYQDYLNQTNQYFSNMLTDVGKKFVETASNVFTRINVNEATNMAKAALRVVNTYFQRDIIHDVTSIEDLQEAPNAMVRWIMCHPGLRSMMEANTIDAYGDRYQDNQPDFSVGWNHFDYCQVYDGWIEPVTVTKTIVNENNEEEEVTETYDEMTQVWMGEEEHEELLDIEADIIRTAHMFVDKALAEKRDPTSYYDNIIVS
jgi:hypothetical protein|nr:MAG TPA: hypothetical protein [Caudoviricetes sp.]